MLMRIRVVDELVWEVPEGSDPVAIEALFKKTYQTKIHVPLTLSNGQVWTLVAIDRISARALPDIEVNVVPFPQKES